MNIPILHCLLSRENTEKKYFFYHGQNGILADGQTFANNNLSGFKFFFGLLSWIAVEKITTQITEKINYRVTSIITGYWI